MYSVISQQNNRSSKLAQEVIKRVKMKVMKFGGSSLADACRFINTANLINKSLKPDAPLFVVCSAPQGVTDTLEKMAKKASNGDESNDVKDLCDKLWGITKDAVKSLSSFDLESLEKLSRDLPVQLERYIKGISLLSCLPDHIYSLVVSKGEFYSVTLIASILQSMGVKAYILDPVEWVKTTLAHKDSKANLQTTREKFQSKKDWENGSVYIIPGFIGGNENNELTTLGRNGSDYSAAVVAYALKADVCEIWTDVSGVYTADPRFVENPHLVENLSYEEAMELSYFGATVLHPKTVTPLAQAKIPCLIKNTMDSSGPSTWIGDNLEKTQLVKGISLLNNLVMFNVSGPGLKGMVGMAARVFKTLASGNISISLITQSSSEYSISFCLQETQQNNAKILLEEEFELELKNNLVSEIECQKHLSIITLIGDGMKEAKGVASRFFNSLFYANVNVVGISQGSSERSISAVIPTDGAIDALKMSHYIFFNHMPLVDVFLIGHGVVGGELIKQIEKQTNYLLKNNIKLSLHGVANSKALAIGDKPFNDGGIMAPITFEKTMILNVENLKKYCRQKHLLNPVVVDCTSSEDITDMYPEFLENGFHIVTPNKKANTRSMEFYQNLRLLSQKHNRQFLYETNVGAGLPVINTLSGLMKAGDELLSFEGILSGSLSYIFGQLDEGKSFAQATISAKEKGFTEPDPRDDLGGMDVARKLLILAREAKMEVELHDISIGRIFPDFFDDKGEVDDFLKRLHQTDEYFKNLATQNSGKRLRFVATIDSFGLKALVKAVGPEHPFYNIKDGENALAFTTKYYSPIPLVIRGFGAGASVTAAGIFADIMKIVNRIN